MKPTVHLIQGALSSAILYPYIGNKAFIFGVSVVMIDLDHFIGYYKDTGRLNVKGLLEYHKLLLDNLDNLFGFNLFHTMECYIALFIGSLYFPDMIWILLGFLFHHLFDQIQLINLKRPFARAFSIVEYFIRKKRNSYYTSVIEVLENQRKLL